jgi:lipoprotein Spr
MTAALPDASQIAHPLEIPPRFFRVRYDGRRYPGSAGANCQRFAYEMLRHFGCEIPDFRSSELWADTCCTRRVKRMRPLDLLLFNRTRRAWGAHVAVYLGRGRAIHLCKAIGRPAVWSFDEFAACDRYRVFVGAKRVRRRRDQAISVTRPYSADLIHSQVRDRCLPYAPKPRLNFTDL